MTLRVAGGPVRGRGIRGGVSDPVLRAGGIYLLNLAQRYTRPGLAFARAQEVYGLHGDGALTAYSGSQVPWEAQGVRLDPGWTQLLRDSHDISLFANWGSGSAVTISKAVGIVAPDGSTPCRMRPTADVSNDHNVSQLAASPTPGQVYTSVSIVKADGYRYWRHRGLGISGGGGVLFDLQTGTVLSLDAWSSAGVTALRDGFKLCWSVGTAAAAVAPIWHVFDTASFTPYAGNGMDGVIVAALNFTNTAYLAPVTVATSAAITVPSFSFAGLNADMGITLGSEYGLGVEYTSAVTASDKVVCGMSSGAFANSIYFIPRNASAQQSCSMISGNVAQLESMSTASAAVGVKQRVLLRAKLNDSRAGFNGSLAPLDSACAMPVGLTNITVGKAPWGGNANDFAGWVSKLFLFPIRGPADAELQALTTL